VPEVSVIIPTYNSEHFIAQTVGSVLAQTFKDIEILIIDDGSVDGTIDAIPITDPRLRIYCQKNAGVAAARNAGIKIANGRFVAFLDHDDFWHPEKLQAQLEAFHRRPEVGVVYGEFRSWVDGTAPSFPHQTLDPGQIVEPLSGWIYHQLLLTNWVLLSTAMFRAEVIQETGSFDESLPPADDWDYVIRASRHYRFCKLAQIVTLYRMHPAQVSRKVSDKDHASALRASAIRRFGLAGPDGARPDPEEFRRRCFLSHFSFGLAQYQVGNKALAAAAFARALRQHPFSLKAYGYLAASVCTIPLHRARGGVGQG
jgi:glycosyltransferase involved in cell wall biosynthesis